MNKIQIYFDGASRGNPGKAGAGVVVKDEKGQLIDKVFCYLGKKTNNQAEYLAVLLSLDFVASLGLKPDEIDFIGDSQLVIRQLSGEYKIRNKQLKETAKQINQRLSQMGVKSNFEHVVRDKNKLADEMANKAIDENDKS